ncbi:MAG TPA: bacteriohopanetetrol glucosamine biosynthesis glycosyltransferase HpnI [Gammaproteobacteria bacterium]|nr:bacteriohopanetetrol glucosamine biosynthesis glycosyltransferase HpnI [Gammaproteobacteria bacterium]
MTVFTSLVTWFGIGVAAVSLGYLLVAVAAMLLWERRRSGPVARTPPMTVLKPLCGSEPELYENLKSFCDQDYPDFQVIFGVRSSDDPALPVVHRLMSEFADRDLQLVIDERVAGDNYKISNVMNMAPLARHDCLVIADSDIRVGPDYLGRLAHALRDPEVGLVTCLYRGHAAGPVWSRLGALFINEWFAPSVLVGRAFGYRAFSFGATMALRREVLDRVGGLESLVSHLADDYLLGERVRGLGLQTVLSTYMVGTTVYEPNLQALWHHELRWARTIRTVQPVGHAFSFITYTIAVSLIGSLVAWGTPWAFGLPAAAFALRSALHLMVSGRRGASALSDLALLPLRDVLSFLVWVMSFGSRRVQWRQQHLSVHTDGSMRLRAHRGVLERALIRSQRETEFRS